MNRRSGTSFIWTILLILGIVVFWRQLLYLILFLIMIAVLFFGYLYYRYRKNIQRFTKQSQNMYKEVHQEEQTYTKKSSNQPVMDAEFTVKSKEID